MGTCASHQKSKTDPARNQSKVTKTTSNRPDSQAQPKQTTRDEGKANEYNKRDPKKDEKIASQITKKVQFSDQKNNLPQIPVLVSNIDQSGVSQLLQNDLKNDQGRINNPSWLKKDTPLSSDAKLRQLQTDVRQGHNSLPHSQGKINEDIPPEPVPKSFQHQPEFPNIRIFGSGVRKVHQEGVIAILELAREDDEENELKKKKTSIVEEVLVQNASRVSGFIWQDKIGKVSIIL